MIHLILLFLAGAIASKSKKKTDMITLTQYTDRALDSIMAMTTKRPTEVIAGMAPPNPSP
jgi:heme O synthase-like polyprenyltransferase